jgi:hypothetical protein
MKSVLFAALFLCSLAQAQISKVDLEIVSRALHQAYDQELLTLRQRFVINPESNPSMKDFWWNLNDVRASYSSLEEEDGVLVHYLFLFGGYARLKGMSRDGVAATLCHEMGHGVGGAPYKDQGSKDVPPVSVEGQADYYAFRVCLRKVFQFLPPAAPVKPLNSWTDSLCRSGSAADYQFCTRAFQTLESERIFFRLSPTEPDTFYDRPDLSVAHEVNLDMEYYPSTQCRLDTMINGILQRPRPACWLKPENH